MRTFTKSQLAEFIKSKLGYDQSHAELVADILFKARGPDKKPRKKRGVHASGAESGAEREIREVQESGQAERDKAFHRSNHELNMDRAHAYLRSASVSPESKEGKAYLEKVKAKLRANEGN